MSVLASFQTELGTKTWEISDSAVKAFTNLSTSYEVEAEDNESVEGSTLTNVKGLKKIPVAFSSQLVRALGVDPREEFESWHDWVGKTGVLRFGGTTFGPNLMLKSVSASNIMTDNSGRWHSAQLAFSFEESDEAVDFSVYETQDSETQNETAANITAPSAKKALKKPMNAQIKAVLLV